MADDLNEFRMLFGDPRVKHKPRIRKKYINAYCTSPECSKNGGLTLVVRTKAGKAARPFYCPECGWALYWKQENSYK